MSALHRAAIASIGDGARGRGPGIAFLALLAAGCSAASPTPEVAAPPALEDLVEYRRGPVCAVEITADPDAEFPVVGRSVCVGFRPGSSVRPALATHEAAGPAVGPEVRLRVLDADGGPLDRRRRGWTVPDDGRWAARWALRPRVASPRDLRVTDEWIAGRGYDVIVTDWRFPRFAAVRVDVPLGWSASTAFREQDPDPGDLLEGWFLLSPARVPTQGIRLAVAPGVVLPDGFEATWEQARRQLPMLGLPDDDFLFVLRPRETDTEPGGDSSRGTARIVPWPAEGEDAAVQLVATLVHEYVHRLLPGALHERVAPRLSGLDLPDDARWFTEGFAEWITRRLLGRAGLIDAEETLRRLGRIEDDRSLLEAGRAAADEPAADALCYAGGALLAAWLDLGLRRAHEGDDDPFFRLVDGLVHSEIEVPLRAATVRDALVAAPEVPIDCVEPLDRYLETSDRPDALGALRRLEPRVAEAWWRGP